MPVVRRRLTSTLARQINLRLFEDKAFGVTSWLGVPIWKEPADLWTYQHIVVETRPDLIVETGTLFGGSALYLATLCDLIGRGNVITVDIKPPAAPTPEHPRIRYLTGSSIAPDIIEQISRATEIAEVVLVILDSDHRYSHVIEEMRIYGRFVTPGSYLVVEDTMFDFTASTEFGRGPAAAVVDYLAHDADFEVDRSRERYLVTHNPGGYLRRRGNHPPR
jgi:cephalosporin hydroxylase